MAKLIQIAAGLFRLPDGRIVLNRRGQSAPVSPGLLAFYGGHVDEGETPAQAIKREIGEETSLNPEHLKFKFLANYKVKEMLDKEFFLYEVNVPNDRFEVYEGDGSESYLPEHILARMDITQSVRFAFEEVVKNELAD